MRKLVMFPVGLCLVSLLACAADITGANVPAPQADEAISTGQMETAVFAGGCFWGVEAVFRHVKGVQSVVSGYAGGSAANAHYDIVRKGTTGHAESVRIVYDPAQVSYGRLLQVFFSVAHDPTELNRQGPDWGTQYRSAIFFANDEQLRIAQAYVDQIDRSKVFQKSIATELVGLKGFYEAETYHQDYFAHHLDERYIEINDIPKIDNLRKQFPDLYVNQ